jgi:hypothetical protein
MMEINEQGSSTKLRKPSLYTAWSLNSSHGNWIYIMTTAEVVVVVMHACIQKRKF